MIAMYSMACGAFVAAAEACTLAKIAEWPVRTEGGVPLVKGSIDGQEISIKVDTATPRSFLLKAAATRLGLQTIRQDGLKARVGDLSIQTETVRVNELRIGKHIQRALNAVVVHAERPYDFVLGEDFLEQVDTEFDLANGVIRIFKPHECGRRPLAYWAPGQAVQVDLHPGGFVRFSVTLNGVEVEGSLQSGDAGATVTAEAARKAGVTFRTPGAERTGCAYRGTVAKDIWSVPFDTLAIGAETIHKPVLQLIEEEPYATALVLGGDFLRAHRVLVSRHQRRMYFTHNGAVAFPRVRTQTCAEIALRDDRRDLDDALKSGDAGRIERIVAAMDAAIRGTPEESRILLRRAAIWLRHGREERASADYTRAAVLEPANPRIPYDMASLWLERQEIARSLALVEEALRLRPDYPEAIGLRAAAKAREGDDVAAVADYDRALLLDPALDGARLNRARALFRLGRYAESVKDLETVGGSGASPRSELWKYFALARSGVDAREPLASAARGLKDEWPAPLLRYQLGEIDADRLLREADSAPDDERRRERRCEAHFGIAQHWLIRRQPESARPWLESARKDCPRSYASYLGAVAELKRLR